MTNTTTSVPTVLSDRQTAMLMLLRRCGASASTKAEIAGTAVPAKTKARHYAMVGDLVRLGLAAHVEELAAPHRGASAIVLTPAGLAELAAHR